MSGKRGKAVQWDAVEKAERDKAAPAEPVGSGQPAPAPGAHAVGGKSAVPAHERLAWAIGLEGRVRDVFPWQRRLLDRFIDGSPPTAIDVPTGMGKTAVMAIWLIARAAGAKVPRRLVYVVDRRAVVDQATQVAEDLRAMVEADAELKQALGLEGALPISTLRGKHVDNREWLADPSVPAIVLGTVDMTGSRLLFGGYGVSRKMRPYHAGLLGVDSLIVLDEAHLVPPFERLIEAIAAGRDARGRRLRPNPGNEAMVPPLRLLSLSATGRMRDDVLGLEEDDRAHPTVKRRLDAKKRVSMRDEVKPGDLAERLAGEAWALASEGKAAARCIVYCNRRDDAVKVRDALEGRRKRSGERIEVELLVGGRRVYEREGAARWLHERGFFAGSGGRPRYATFVVATSAGEVGVDLDADHLVCDLVAWERMVQRCGRVNRRGEGDAAIIVVPAKPEDESEKEHLAAVRALIDELPRAGKGKLDASPGALATLRERARRKPALAELVTRASTPQDLHPPLTRATIEAWSMTSFEQHAGRPEVEPWIRGWVEGELPQTTIVWRAHLPVMDRGPLLERAHVDEFREAAGPHLAERLETETWRVVDWLHERLEAVVDSRPEGAEGDEPTRPFRANDVAAVILDGPLGARPVRVDDLSTKEKRDRMVHALEGGLLLVDVRVGGLVDGLLSAQSDEASDVSLIDGAERVVPFRVRRIADGEAASSPEWRAEARFVVRRDEEDETVWLVVESLATATAESQEGRAVSVKRAQLLSEHQNWAEHAAADIAKRLELPEPHSTVLRTAARLHDAGKQANCWQRAFRAPSSDIYAKTTSHPSLGVLGGYRHELGSLGHVERNELVQRLDPPLRDLCLHIIAAHHGNARPLIETEGAEEPPSKLARRAQDVALRFARLEQQWGPWGLAWWETLLRAADQQASRRNDFEGGSRG